VLAQLGTPDMRLPIEYALTYPDRTVPVAEPLDLLTCPPLTFEAPDREKFPCLGLALDAARIPGTACAILNGANEVAVAAFLEDRIGFMEIPELVQRALETVPNRENPTLEEILAADADAREAVRAALR
jgi:1-deoxy-D-xylulose-5-phosphate reductoisomerase